jgi:predicted transcriptional regulator
MQLLILSKKKDIGVLLGRLESTIMDILWTKGPMKGRDLHLEIRNEKDIAYTTTLTVLDRLSKKGFINKDRSSGTIIFSTKLSKEVYQGTVAENLVQKAFEMSSDLAIAAFADLFPRMPKKDLDRLEKLLEEKKNGVF